LPIFSFLAFLGLLFCVGTAKYTWNGGASFGNRYFLVLTPLLVLCVAACFERLSIKKQAIIALISGIWSFLLLLLFISEKEPDSFYLLIKGLNMGLMLEFMRFLRRIFFEHILTLFIWKLLLIVFILAGAFLLINLIKKAVVYRLYRNTIFIYSMVSIIVYIDALLMQCFFNDRKVIADLEKRGYYKNVVFGNFNKADVAECYLDSTEDTDVNERQKGQSIQNIIMAMHTYPPYRPDCLKRLYAMYKSFPGGFQREFLKSADASDCYDLSREFQRNGDFRNSRFFADEALKLKPDIRTTAAN
jgi:hypothetical protein